MDKYFDPIWEQEHLYLAAVWRLLLSAPGNKLFARVREDLFILLQKGAAGSDRLVMSWGAEKDRLNGFLIDKIPFVAADDLSSLFMKAKDEGLPFPVDEDFVPLDLWKPA